MWESPIPKIWGCNNRIEYSPFTGFYQRKHTSTEVSISITFCGVDDGSRDGTIFNDTLAIPIIQGVPVQDVDLNFL